MALKVKQADLNNILNFSTSHVSRIVNGEINNDIFNRFLINEIKLFLNDEKAHVKERH